MRTAFFTISMFLFSVFLIISGHGKIGMAGLIQMLVGTGGLLLLLYQYNKRHA